ncbi:MAG: hypothetical protein WC822_03975 [Candidatus Paceibacterota bacterium]|jgi:hypothetical protein
MEIRTLLGVLSALFIAIGTFPYLIDIHNKKVNPHILSWVGWGFITALGAFAMLASGSEWVVAVLLANTFFCFLIVVYSIFKKVGVWLTTKFDYIFFGLGLLGLILWQYFNMPILAIVCAILADFFFGLPTLVKTFNDPKTETYFLWLTSGIADLLSLLSAKSFSFSELAFSSYLFLFETIMLLIITGVISKKSIVENI